MCGCPKMSEPAFLPVLEELGFWRSSEILADADTRPFPSEWIDMEWTDASARALVLRYLRTGSVPVRSHIYTK